MAWYDFTLTRRCIAVDLGESRIKAILAERKGRRIEILHAFNLDLQEEGLLTPDETNRHVSRILSEMGDYPVSLVVPQHIAVSHLIALPADYKGRRGARMIEEETQKLVGLSESAIVYDYFRLKPLPKNRNPIWVTVSREEELSQQIDRLRDSELFINSATNSGNALASAYIASQPKIERVALADIGATSTTLVVLEEMQPIYATVFPFGGELFSETLAASRGLDFEEAESLKKSEMIFSDPSRDPEFIRAVKGWHRELRKVLQEALQVLDDSDDSDLPVALSGGGSIQPGFIQFLRKECELDCHTWKDQENDFDPQSFAVVYGAALNGLGIAPIKTSLLPRPLQQAHFRALQATALNAVVAVLFVVLFAVLFFDASAKREGLLQKEAALEELQEAHHQTTRIEGLLRKRNETYRQIVPVVRQEERTRNLLQTIDLMQEIREDHEIWFTLIADAESYLRESVGFDSGKESTDRRSGRDSRREQESNEEWIRSNRFIAELSIPAEGRETLLLLRSVVDALNDAAIFQNVDTLAPAEQQSLVAEEVIIPDQTFSISLKLEPGDLFLSPAKLQPATPAQR